MFAGKHRALPMLLDRVSCFDPLGRCSRGAHRCAVGSSALLRALPVQRLDDAAKWHSRQGDIFLRSELSESFLQSSVMPRRTCLA